MKNIVLIDFTEESIDALRYAVDFTKAIDGTLEILNVTDNDKSLEDGQRLMDLKKQYSSANFEIKVNELIGNVEEEITEFVNGQKIGFVFCGTHDLKFLERFFASRVMNIMNHVKANFVFVPHNLKKYEPVKEVLMPVFSDKHSLQNIEALRYLHHFMPFNIKVVTNSKPTPEAKNNLLVATKLLQNSQLAYSIETFGDSEDELRKQLADLGRLTKSDLISIVNLTEQNLFNFGTKGFVEHLIRNEQGLPVLVIQNQETEVYSGFHTAGGY